jgi:hypothetical protein
MEQTPQASRRTLLIGLGAAVGLIVVIALVTYAIFGTSKRDNATSGTGNSSEDQVATKEEVKAKITDLGTSIKQAAEDQSAAKAALKDDEKRVKVGN